MRRLIKDLKLQSQVIIITIVAVIICFISMVVILPNMLTGVYENNIYQLLEQPLDLLDDENDIPNEDVAFIIINPENRVVITSSNFNKIVTTSTIEDIIKIAIGETGKLQIKNKTYYYVMQIINNKKVISITNDNYINEQKEQLNELVVPAMLFVSIITTLLLSLYSNFLVNKITKLNNKVDNFENKNFDHSANFFIEDELYTLNKSLEKTRKITVNKEEYIKNMLQTISHELKTPIMVILSHIEAFQEHVITEDKAISVIKNEAEILNEKALMVMQLNKINYLKTINDIKIEDVDLKPIINESIDRFKMINKNIDYEFKVRGTSIFRGTSANWSTIVNNILSNFVRYANRKIIIKIYNNKISFFNDGENIKESLLDNIFEPYTIGKKGKTGLGLAIVKEIAIMYGYNIKVINESNGVTFVIN